MLIFLIISTSVADLTFPLEREEIGKSCVNEAGQAGTYEFLQNCKNAGMATAFVKFAGPALCCVERNSFSRKITARSFCFEYGTYASSVLFDKVIGGEKTEVGEFPFMAAIAYQNLDREIEFDCGGAIVSEKFVVTAGHCSNLKGRQPQFVRVGRVSGIRGDFNLRLSLFCCRLH